MGRSGKRRALVQSVTESDLPWRVRCICGAREEASGASEIWIQCGECGRWQHNICMGISTISSEMPEHYECQDCEPEAHLELLSALDRGESLWEKRKMAHNTTAAGNGEEHVQMSVAATLPLTAECHHYTRRKDVEWDIQKYWDQRYSIFSRYDEGICMTDDAWFGVTPEPVALKIANDLANRVLPTKTTLIDLFAGAGGNTIAFALSGRWATIISIEKNASALACAQNNAAIYGVADKITWIHDDCFKYLTAYSETSSRDNTCVFASPPWGGPGYTTDDIFDLSQMKPYSVDSIYSAVKDMDVALFLPRTSDLRQIARLSQDGAKIDVLQYCMEGASKGLVAYLPAVKA